MQVQPEQKVINNLSVIISNPLQRYNQEWKTFIDKVDFDIYITVLSSLL